MSMLQPTVQAASPRAEWIATGPARGALWADGTTRLRLQTWFLVPAGQPPGVYAAFDFRGDRKDGTMDCGYIVVHRAAPGAAYHRPYRHLRGSTRPDGGGCAQGRPTAPASLLSGQGNRDGFLIERPDEGDGCFPACRIPIKLLIREHDNDQRHSQFLPLLFSANRDSSPATDTHVAAQRQT